MSNDLKATAHALAEARATLLMIQRELDRKEWSPDTLDAIAEHMRFAGFEIRPPEEES